MPFGTAVRGLPMRDLRDGSVDRTDADSGNRGPIPFGDAIVGIVCLLMAVSIVWSLVEIFPYLVEKFG